MEDGARAEAGAGRVFVGARGRRGGELETHGERHTRQHPRVRAARRGEEVDEER